MEKQNLKYDKTLQSVFEKMEKIYNDDSDTLKHLPHNPVIRFNNDKTWELTSSLFSAEDCISEISLDCFHDYFDAAYNTDYTISAKEEQDFLQLGV